MKEVTPQLEDGASDLARILPSETPSERPAPPWGAIHELVAAGDSSSLQEAILSLMEAVGLDCPHLGLSGVRGEGWQLTAHRGVPESLLDQVRENLVRMASDLSLASFGPIWLRSRVKGGCWAWWDGCGARSSPRPTSNPWRR